MVRALDAPSGNARRELLKVVSPRHFSSILSSGGTVSPHSRISSNHLLYLFELLNLLLLQRSILLLQRFFLWGRFLLLPVFLIFRRYWGFLSAEGDPS